MCKLSLGTGKQLTKATNFQKSKLRCADLMARWLASVSRRAASSAHALSSTIITSNISMIFFKVSADT